MLKQSVIMQAISLIVLSAPLALAAPGDPAPVAPMTAPPPPPLGPAPTMTPVPPPQPTTVQPAMAPVSATSKYQSGSIVAVYPLEPQYRESYKKGQELGKFITSDNPWSLGLHKKDAGLAFFQDKPLGYETDALFHAKETGEYSFVAIVALPPTIIFEDPKKLRKKNSGWISCHYQLQVGSQTVIDMRVNTKTEGKQKELICGLTKFQPGSTKLAEGTHRVKQSFYCDGERQYKKGAQYSYPPDCKEAGKPINADIFPGDEVDVTLMVRRPQESAPVLLETGELFHEKK